MNILFLGYWSITDGLSVATIKPHLEILSSFHEVKAIYYISLERDSEKVNCQWDIPKLNHIPYYTGASTYHKITELFVLTRFLIKFCRKQTINKIIARSSPAGSFAYLVHRKTGIPYYVESFEPHADYMLESGVWKNWDPRYLLQKYFEKKIKYTANGLMPVSNNYKLLLEKNNAISCDVETMPCSVNMEKFRFIKDSRIRIRQKLKINKTTIVGIYAGKFGGIYYDHTSFNIFNECFKEIDSFFLVILTPHDNDVILKKSMKQIYQLIKFGLVR